MNELQYLKVYPTIRTIGEHLRSSASQSACLTSQRQLIIKTEPTGLSSWIIQAVPMFHEKWTCLKIDVFNLLMSRCEKHLFITEEFAAVLAPADRSAGRVHLCDRNNDSHSSISCCSCSAYSKIQLWHVFTREITAISSVSHLWVSTAITPINSSQPWSKLRNLPAFPLHEQITATWVKYIHHVYVI